MPFEYTLFNYIWNKYFAFKVALFQVKLAVLEGKRTTQKLFDLNRNKS